MCAGEVTKHKFVGARTIDAGDLIATLEGCTTIGIGRTPLPSLRFRGSQALDATLSDLSITCNPKDASRAMYIIAGPSKEMNMDMVKSISEYIKKIQSLSEVGKELPTL